MKEMFNKIHQTMSQPLTPKQKVQKIMTDIGGGWYMEKIDKGITPLRIPKISKFLIIIMLDVMHMSMI